MTRVIGTARAIGVGICGAVLLVLDGTAALACDTGSWLAVDGNAHSGAVVTVRGGGLEPGPTMLVWERSGGEVLGETSVPADGRLEVAVEIPAGAAGRHTIIAIPAALAESPVDLHAWTDVVVPGGAVAPQPAQVPTGRATAGASLPAQAGVGLAALTVAALGLAVRRRRAAVRSSAAGTGGVDALDAELAGLLDEQHDPSRITDATGSPISR